MATSRTLPSPGSAAIRLGGALAAVVALAACSAPKPPDAGSRSASPAARTAAAPVDPCSTASGSCMHVLDVDVTGDGRSDPVGVESAAGTESAAEIVTVHVGVDGGVRSVKLPATRSANAYTEPSDIFRGAFSLSRPQGADIVVHLVPGAGDADQFAVIGWEDDRPTVLGQPDRGRPAAGTPGVWYLQSSHGVQESVACRTPGEIAVVARTPAPGGGTRTPGGGTRTPGGGTRTPGGGTRTEVTFRYSGDAWQQITTTTVADSGFHDTWSAHEQAFDCTPLGSVPRS
ncbi:hypothetical protein [Gordonia shandongensis]|uniref:hypothetical protein n=1 Tax=Gordonia shandongensis TaxID=376351 RepID=UPI000479D06A|nr:hypothetical protein [Gordonia shandongensis]